MKKLVTVTAVTLLCGPAFAQNTGPAPQTGMERPGTTSGAKPDGSMDTTGMSATKGNIKRDKDGAPAPKDEKNTLKSSLDQAKQQALAQQIQQQQGSATPTATPKKEK